MSEWTTPPQSVEFAAPATGLGALRQALTSLNRRIARLEGSAPLRQAGAIAREGRLASLDFDGVDREHLGTAGWMLGSDDGGPSYLALNGVDVKADLDAKDATILGMIDELADLVSKQVSPASASNYEVNFTVATADEDRAAATIAVPAGYSRAVVMMVANVGVINPRTSVDYIYCSAAINGVASREMFALAGANGGSASIATSKASVLTGLTGGSSVTVAARLHAQGGAWSANASNRVYVEAQAVFLR
ncbi:MAG: hypothetical protein HGA44_18650 [Cellulomonadaceae bacterium]|nr:hypothetical protein [Cellulomonadaceae bacterium]